MRDMTAKRTETALTILIAIGVIIANFWHIIVSRLAQPPGTFFTWIAHYYADYFLYVSQIGEGIRGNLLWSASLFTNEPVPATWVYWPNVTIGNIARLTGLSAFAAYNIGLVVFVVFLLIGIRILTMRLYPGNPLARLIAFLFAVTASNFFSVSSFFRTGALSLWQDMWFSPTPALNRLGGVPHQTLQTILIFGVILVFSRVAETKISIKQSLTPFVVLPLLCFLAATLSPIQLLLLCAAITVTTVILKPTKASVLTIGTGVVTAALGAYLVNTTFDASPLYAAAKAWEAAQQPPVSLIALFLAMGPVIFFLPWGVTAFVRTLTPLKLVLFLYGVLSLAVFVSPIPSLLHTSPTRWIHPASLVIYYFVAAEGFIVLTNRLTDVLARRIPAEKKSARMAVILNTLLFLYCMLTIPALISQVRARMTPVLSGTLNYVPQKDMAALTALAQTPSQNVVLMDPTLPYDVLVPAVSGKPSFTGHPVHTLYLSAKEQLRTRFFHGAMSNEEAQSFLSDHTIGEVVYSQATAKHRPPYPFFRMKYQNDAVIIYEIIR
jgi:hypothetical protein